MIVTCDSCDANFKVDDSRIPPDGIKVRCSKCKSVFMVKREVPEDFSTEFEEFESFHREKIDEAPAGEKAVDEAAEPFAGIPEEPAGGISFEEFMAKEEPAPEMGEAELAGEEPISREIEQAVEPFLEERAPEESDSQPPLVQEPSETPEVAPAQAPPEMEETELSVEAYFKEEMERESRDQGREGALNSLKDKRFEDLVKEKGLERRSARRRSSLKVILLLVLLLALGAGAYVWWQNRGASVNLPTDIGSTIKAAVGKVSDLWEDIVGAGRGSLELSGLQGYEDEIGQHRVYIIKGSVTNKSRRAKRSVKLKVIILDQAGNRIKEKEIFCGNVFTRQELEKLSPRFFTGDEILQPRRPKDMVVEAHKTISFMAIFTGLPREGKSFKVEILEAPGV